MIEFISKYLKALHWESVALVDADDSDAQDDEKVFVLQKKMWLPGESSLKDSL